MAKLLRWTLASNAPEMKRTEKVRRWTLRAWDLDGGIFGAKNLGGHGTTPVLTNWVPQIGFQTNVDRTRSLFSLRLGKAVQTTTGWQNLCIKTRVGAFLGQT